MAALGVGWTAAAVATGVNWEQLRANLSGDLVLPGDAGYDVAKQLDSRYFDSVNPAAVAYCKNPQDVHTCLLFAQDNDISIAVRSGGHSSGGYSTTTGLIVDVSRLNQVAVTGSTVTIGPGVQGVDAVNALAPLGLALVAGLGATVCAGGFLQGGGMSLLSRKFGIGCDRLVSADVVLASGRQVHCSATCEPDLFWALRGGGGGNFGVVTRFEVAPTTVTHMVTYSLVWAWEHAADVVAAQLPWLGQSPDDLAANLVVVNPNAAPGTVPSVSISGAWFGGDLASLQPHLDELVAMVGAAPVNRASEDLPYQQAMMRFFGCADKTVAQCHRVGYTADAMLPRRGFNLSRGRLAGQPLNATAINDALTAVQSDPHAGQFRGFSVNGLGGQINRVARTATAYVHRSAVGFYTFAASLSTATPTPDERAAVESYVDAGFAVIKNGNQEDYVNTIDPRLTDWRSAYYAENYPRLVRVKHTYDPDTFFRFPQAIGV
jgi:FAD/FMN-containing dehydrogenase